MRRFFLIAVFSVAFCIRFLPLIEMGFNGSLPFGQGGFYIKIAQQIVENNFRLPRIIPHYTAGGVPYAYPPLVFYLEAFLIKMTSLSIFEVSSLLPAIFSSFSVVAFYFLAKEIFDKFLLILISTTAFSLIPFSFIEHLPGEGVVEALGTTLFILDIYFMLRIFRKERLREAVWLGVFLALSILSSPGAGYGSLVIIFFLSLLNFRRSKKLMGLLLLAFFLGLILSSPYWLVVVDNQSSQIFIGTLIDQYRLFFIGSVVRAFTVWAGSRLVFLPLASLLFVGLVVNLLRQRFFLPLFWLLTYFIPREFVYLVPVPISFLVAQGIDFLLGSLKGKTIKRRLFLTLLFFYGFSLGFYFSRELGQKKIVSEEELTAMRWVRENSAKNANFLVVGDEIEWFPVLAQRTVVNASYGAEWKEKGWPAYRFQKETDDCRTLDCVRLVAAKFEASFGHLYVSKGEFLADELKKNKKWRLVFENGGAIIVFADYQ